MEVGERTRYVRVNAHVHLHVDAALQIVHDTGYSRLEVGPSVLGSA